MIVLALQAFLFIFAFNLDDEYAKYIPLSFPLIYILILGPGAFTGTRDINKEQLIEALSQNWINAEELAEYIMKFWVAFEYCTTAWARQYNCTTLSFATLGFAIWLYLDNELATCVLSFACGVILWMMSIRVNRPQSIFSTHVAKLSNNEQIFNEWLMAAMSMVAFAELFPHPRFSYMSKNVLSDEIAKNALNVFRIREIS